MITELTRAFFIHGCTGRHILSYASWTDSSFLNCFVVRKCFIVVIYPPAKKEQKNANCAVI